MDLAFVNQDGPGDCAIACGATVLNVLGCLAGLDVEAEAEAEADVSDAPAFSCGSTSALSALVPLSRWDGARARAHGTCLVAQLKAALASDACVAYDGRPEGDGLWTVELLRLLECVCGRMLAAHEGAGGGGRLRVHLEMTTSEEGVPAAHADADFYRSPDFAEEAARIGVLLRRYASARGTTLSPGGGVRATLAVRVYPIDELAALAAQPCSLLVVLVDSNVLRCLCGADEGAADDTVVLPCSCLVRGRGRQARRTRFHGHYVVVFGADVGRRRVFYHDPVSPTCGTCVATYENFEAAKSREGTDNDVVRVWWEVGG
eukprot:Rhum_TRINITY_DN13718_c0_g1::Rhum_TRINITY_DN13718_c0_g1_i1::g.63303::m.63303